MGADFCDWGSLPQPMVYDPPHCLQMTGRPKPRASMENTPPHGQLTWYRVRAGGF
jgi:hypothetical protein